MQQFAGFEGVKRKIEVLRKEIIRVLSWKHDSIVWFASNWDIILSHTDGAKTIRIPATPLLRILLRLFPEQSAFLAIVQLLISLGEIQELQDPLTAVDRRELPGRVPVDVQRPDITSEFH